MRYITVEPIKRGGKRTEPGKPVEMTEAEARPLLDSGILGPYPAAKVDKVETDKVEAKVDKVETDKVEAKADKVETDKVEAKADKVETDKTATTKGEDKA